MSEKIIENVLEKSDNKNHETKNRRFYGIPYPKIYRHEIRVSCHLCHKTGQPKIHKNIWNLRLHFSKNHTSDLEIQEAKNTIGELVDYIRLEQSFKERGILR